MSSPANLASQRWVNLSGGVPPFAGPPFAPGTEARHVRAPLGGPGEAMTVCIAALCSDQQGKPGAAVVMAADRLLTAAGIERAAPIPKIAQIADRVVLARAGNVDLGYQFLDSLATAFKQQKEPRIGDALAHWIALRYSDMHARLIDQYVFGARGMSIDGFYGGRHKDTAPPLAAMIDKEAKEYNCDVELLMGVVDDTGAHIYGIWNPGTWLRYDANDFVGCGSGSWFARLWLTSYGQNQASSLLDTIFRAYCVVRRAEALQGVGAGADIAIVQASGISRLTDKDQRILEARFDDMTKAEKDAMLGALDKSGLFPAT